MELMSSLLLFSLVVCLPQALGETLSNSGGKIDANNTKLSDQSTLHKKLQHNHYEPTSELQSIFLDARCKKCVDCMGRAVHKYKTNAELKKKTAYSELREEISSNKLESKNRMKRDDDVTTSAAQIKKNKSKRKPTKTVTVTKYNIDGEVYGLKVKETKVRTDEGNESSMCRIYSVKKSYACDTPESESFLTSKRKGNKKSKKEKEKSITSSTTPQAYYSSSSYRKRQIDPSEMPDNVELSMEDVY